MRRPLARGVAALALVVLAAASLLSPASAAASSSSSSSPSRGGKGGAGVVELTADSFDAATAQGDWLVEFYAPWWGHCKQLAPDLERAARQLASEGAGTRVARVDAPEWRSLAIRFNVAGYPTFFHVHNGGAGLGPASREVRRINPDHSLEGIKYAATEGWRGGAPLAWAEGPFGPVAMAKFYAFFYGERVFKAADPAAEWLGVPPIFMQFGLGMVLLCAFTAALIVAAVMLGQRERRLAEEADRRELHPHTE